MKTKTKNIQDFFSSRVERMPSSFIRDILKVAAQKDYISFAGGLPDPSCFPMKEIEESSAAVFKMHGPELLQYSKSEGLASLKAWICQYYSRTFGLQVLPQEVLITNGSQQALDLIGKAFIDPGDGLVLEEPSYLGAIQAFSAYEPQLLHVPIQTDGMDVEALENLLHQHQPKLVYLVPNFQNPTGFSISLTKRQRLAALAQERGFLIVEDDPYGALRFEGEALKPIRSFSRQSILCGSFSKMVAPGLRVGWIIAEEFIIQKLLIMKQASDLHTNNLSQYVIDHYLHHYSFEQHLQKIKECYGHKSNYMYDVLKSSLPQGCSLNKSEGGMFLWIELPKEMDADEILGKCMEQKVLFVPGKYFHSRGGGKHTIRLNFTNSTYKNIENGIFILCRAITESMKKNAAASINIQNG